MMNAIKPANEVQVTEIAFTCYPVTDMQRARRFYEGLLNLVPSSAYDVGPNSWVEYEVSGGTFSLGYMQGGPEPTTHGGVIALEFKQFESTVQVLKDAGAVFKMEPFETPACRMAVVRDSEGNSLIIHQLKVNQLKQEFAAGVCQ